MDQAEILGSPVGSQNSVDDAIMEKIRLLGLMGERLLRHSYAISKVLHVLQSSLSYSSPCLEDYDGCLRNTLSQIMNIRLEPGPLWAQASLSDPLHAGVLAHPAPPVPPQKGEGHLARTLCCTTDLTVHPSGILPLWCCYYS